MVRSTPGMAASLLRITSAPPGEAPLWVREKWVGLSLPLARSRAVALSVFTSGVLSGPKSFFASIGALLTGRLTRRSGFLVETQAAIAVLAKSSPEAATWWRQNTPHLLRPRRYFVFPEDAGQVMSGPGA
jgi:hypothetical protein